MMFQGYIKASQGGCIRFDPNINNQIPVFNLCTDDLTICIGIIIKGNEGRISLIHADYQTSPAAIVDEHYWVGQPTEITFALNPYYYETDRGLGLIFDDFFAKIEQELSAKKITAVKLRGEYTTKGITSAIAINVSSRDIQTPQSNMKIGEAAPNLELRHSINMLNAAVNSGYKRFDLQFNNGNWTPMPCLVPDAIKIFQYCKPHGDNTKYNQQILQVLLSNLLNSKKLYLNGSLKYPLLVKFIETILRHPFHSW